jgi:hypothetical protein
VTADVQITVAADTASQPSQPSDRRMVTPYPRDSLRMLVTHELALQPEA